MDLKELKAMAYDLMAQIEMLQGRFREVNEAIAREAKKQNDVKAGDPQPFKPKKAVKDEVKVEEVKVEEEPKVEEGK